VQPRQKFIVDWRFQLRYIQVWFWVAAIVIGTLFIFYLVVRNQLRPPEMREVVLEMVWGFSAYVILACVLLALITVLATHKVAGAAFNLTRSIDRLKRNDLGTAISVRPKDHLQNLADGLEELRVEIQKRHETLQAQVAELERLKASLPAAGEIAAKIQAQIAPQAPPAS